MVWYWMVLDGIGEYRRNGGDRHGRIPETDSPLISEPFMKRTHAKPTNENLRNTVLH